MMRYRLTILFVTWLALVGSGLYVLANHAATPGASGQAPSDWPARSLVARTPDTHTLVLLAHPRCPCTRATLSELAQVVAQCRQRLQVIVFILKPSDTEVGWERTGIWSAAEAIPGVQVMVDQDGIESTQFGAMTSGHAVLYDSAGKRLFSGGITGGRGHEGDNAGKSAVVAHVLGKAEKAPHEAPVYGCPLTSGDLQGE